MDDGFYLVIHVESKTKDVRIVEVSDGCVHATGTDDDCEFDEYTGWLRIDVDSLYALLKNK